MPSSESDLPHCVRCDSLMSCRRCGSVSDDLAELRSQVERVEKANDILQTALKDLDATYSGEVCPRVQCQGAYTRLERERGDLRAVCVRLLAEWDCARNNIPATGVCYLHEAIGDLRKALA